MMKQYIYTQSNNKITSSPFSGGRKTLAIRSSFIHYLHTQRRTLLMTKTAQPAVDDLHAKNDARRVPLTWRIFATILYRNIAWVRITEFCA